MLNYILNQFRTAPLKSSQIVLFFGFGILMNHKYRTSCSFNSEISDIQSPSLLYPLHIIFNRSLSNVFSKLVDLSIPQSIRLPLFKTLVYTLGVDVNELVYPLDAYESLGMFFTRNLPDSIRPIRDYSDNIITSPVDGKVMVWGEINRDRIKQIDIKGASYNVNCLVGEKIVKSNRNKRRLYYIVFKIPLGSYHHFHSPANFELNERRYFPGESIPLGEFIADYFSDIFTVNERVVFKGVDGLGNKMFVVPVGTFCLGKITHNIDNEFCMSRSGQIQVYLGGPIETKHYDEPIIYKRGDEIGEFKQGSAIAIIFENDGPVEWNVNMGDSVKMGERIVKLTTNKINS